MSELRLCGQIVHRTGSWYWGGAGVVDIESRPVDEVAAELGCGWHTVNNEVGRWGEALLEADTDRIGEVQAVGVDETLLGRKGRWRTKVWCTSVVDVGGHQPVRHSRW